MSINDAALHIPTLPFGGVGESGYGAYRGRASFEAFIHRRPITSTPGWLESLVSLRYPPYEGKLSYFKKTSALSPDFDRSCKASLGWLRFIFTVGMGTVPKSALRISLISLSKSKLLCFIRGFCFLQSDTGSSVCLRWCFTFNMAVFTVICDEIYFCPNISSSNTNGSSGTPGAPELGEKIFETVTGAK